MANNFHSDLPNEQLHNPKDYITANNSSVLTKSQNGNLDWNTSPYGTSTTITCTGDVSGGLHNKNFYVFYSETEQLEMHFKVSGETAAFTPTAGYDQATIDINANNTNLQVAAEIMAELGRLPAKYNFSASVDGKGKVTFSGMTNAADTIDGNTGFPIQNTKTYTGTTVLTSTQGRLEWLPGGGGGGGGAVNDVSAGTPGTSSGTPLSVTPTTGSVVVKSNAYNGTTNVGHVPTGGSATTFLRGDGTWVTPTTGSTYSAGTGVDATNLANNIIALDGSVVRTTGTQNITGDKAFFDPVYLDKPATDDKSSRAVTSQWVNDQNYGRGTVTSITAGTGLTGGTITNTGTIGLSTDVPIKSSANTYRGANAFLDDVSFGKIPKSVTPPARTNDTSVATCQFVMSELQSAGGGVTDVTAKLPLSSSGGKTPDISMKAASLSQDGYLSKTAFKAFDGKQNPIKVTSTGTGAATLIGGNTINVPLAQVKNKVSFRGSINVSRAGTYAQTTSTSPLAHVLDIEKGSTIKSIEFLGGAFHNTVANEELEAVAGIIEGTGDCTIELWGMLVDCTGTNTPVFTKLGISPTITLVAGKATCWSITPRPGQPIRVLAGTSMLLAIKPGPSDAVTAVYNAQYISTL